MIKKVLITDIDNTLFDWFNVWFNSFNAMLQKTSEISEIPVEILIPEIREIHKKYGTSEYAFLLQELPSLLQKYGNKDEILKRLDEAIHLYRSERKKNLRLYDGVLTTLKDLKKRGVTIVAFTESQDYFTRYRITKLGLDGIIDYVFSPESHLLPEYITPENDYKLEKTIHCHIPLGEKKPNPKILLDIINHIGAIPEECVYIGDSEMKDIAMAQKANVSAVFAKYGNEHFEANIEGYELLKSVTHWSDEDVKYEQKIKEENKFITIDYSVSKFSEILVFFNFKNSTEYELELTKIKVDIWKQVISTQQHFNLISMKIRNFAILFLSAFIGAISAIGETLKTHITITVFSHPISASFFICIAATIIWMLLFFMDVYWYHPLLIGTVKKGIHIEKNIGIDLRQVINLSETVGKESPTKLLCGKEIHSTQKAKIVYWTVFVMFIILSYFLF